MARMEVTIILGQGRYQIGLPAPSERKCQYIQFEGANHIAEGFCNGEFVGVHKGGFSTFRFELTKYLKERQYIRSCSGQ